MSALSLIQEPMKKADSSRQRQTAEVRRLKAVVRGAVQGVGFRPFIYRLAVELGLSGWVTNSCQGVFIEAEGTECRLKSFLLRIEAERPPQSFIQSLEWSLLDPTGMAGFKIRPSETAGGKTALILPDIAACPDCLREIFDPADRRHLYPFTNCTHCGPRFSIIQALPYDRSNTTMKDFAMCEHCRAEHANPADRRFHAQPNACPECGPRLELWNRRGKLLASRHDALLQAADALRQGVVVAVKGLGGFHLMVNAVLDEEVRGLRRAKHREEKPFALMYPSLKALAADCEFSDLEKRLLLSSESPIVILPRKRPFSGSRIAPSVAPGNPCLGAMLPYTPLHHLLMAQLGFPVVATSGNLSDEPICTDEREAVDRLGGIAELFLVHNRPIARHVDDSIIRVMAGREMVLRRARGYAPLPAPFARDGVFPREENAPAVLAVGAHLKNSVAIGRGRKIFISQHIGDLETAPAWDAFQRVIADFQRLYDMKPAVVAFDLHPDYLSTQFARKSGLASVAVQHHHAHVLSCMAENELEGPVLGVSWDGAGYGPDGSIWGGEFLLAHDDAFVRAAHLRTFRLPGGEKAIREPRRAAIGLLWELWGGAMFRDEARCPAATIKSFTARDLDLLQEMLCKEINTPHTSSVGRLFDAVAALVGIRQMARFEGQAAMELEFALDGIVTDEAYPLRIREDGAQDNAAALTNVGPMEGNPRPCMIVDWAPMVEAIVEDARSDVPTRIISARFHNALVEAVVDVARRVGSERVALTGGCFQNKHLTERAVRRLKEEGFRPCWHQRVPPNDGGIAFGQAVAAVRRASFRL